MPTVTPGEAPSTQPADPWLPPVDGTGFSPLIRDLVDVRVAKYFPGEAVQFEELDNVRVVDFREEIGTNAPVCRLQYVFDGVRGGIANAPANFEEALSTLYWSPKTIDPGDRIVVGAYRPSDMAFKPIFDGEAISFEGALSGDGESVTVLCRGIAARAMDYPIVGALVRDGDAPLTVSDIQTDSEPWFNPRGRPNCCPDGAPRGSVWAIIDDAPESETFPTFLDPDNTHTGDEAPTYWDLAKAVRYLCFKHNDREFVRSPIADDIDSVLAGSGEVRAPDKPVGGKDWPSAVRELIADKGYETRWTLGTDYADGGTVTTFEVFDPRTRTPKDIFLQARDTTLALEASNVASGSFARDLSGTVNDWEVQGDFVEVEASFILACGFANVPTLTAEDFDAYSKNHPDFAAKFNDFRLFVLDESGEGHYLPGSTTLVTDVPDLDAVLGAKVDGERVWSIRRRPPIGDLFSAPTGAPTSMRFKHSLSISTDYAGADTGKCPAVWGGSGTWQPVKGPYELLKDRVGIRITAKNPNAWDIGKSEDEAHPFKSGKVNVIECLANAAAGENKKFYLRLTCVIRRDARVIGRATWNAGSPLPHTVRRIVDANDRYKKQIILEGSEFALDEGGPFTEDVLARDDTDAATAEAVALQAATANGQMSGSVVIPWLTRAYEIGDPIRSLYGRSLGFRTDDGDPAGTPVYPIVTAIRHTFGPQTTELELSDATIARSSYVSRSARRQAAPPASRRGSLGHGYSRI